MSGGEWLEGIIREAHGWDGGRPSGWPQKAEPEPALPPDSSPAPGYDGANTEGPMAKKNLKVADAVSRVADAEARLEEARKDARKARAEALALEADRRLNEAAQAVWKVAEALDHADWLHKLEGAVEKVRDEIALKLLDAGPRVEGLGLLDPDRWGPGEYSTGHPHSFLDDDDLYPTLATWIFDRMGVRGYEEKDADNTPWMEDERAGHNKTLARFQEQIEAAFLEATGDAARAQEIAEESIAAWRAGRHDT